MDKNPERGWLKSDLWETFGSLQTDQQRGVEHPPLQKPYPDGAPLIELPPPAKLEALGQRPLAAVIAARRSRRRFRADPLTLDALAFLLWATQGVREVGRGGAAAFRTVPSAGARHAFETYLVVNRVQGLEPGLYRYLSLDHRLCGLRVGVELAEQAAVACNRQGFVAQSAVTFAWTAIPYRMEWRYSVISPKLIALDAGHVCQNLYLAAEAIGAGTCAIAAYNQRLMDALLEVDGEDEFTVYVAPVGKV